MDIVILVTADKHKVQCNPRAYKRLRHKHKAMYVAFIYSDSFCTYSADTGESSIIHSQKQRIMKQDTLVTDFTVSEITLTYNDYIEVATG